jgi:hypothetical protein
MQNQESDIRNFEMHKSNRFIRGLESDTLFIFNNLGEHYSHYRLGLSLASAYKMKDTEGKETDLWEALDVIKENGVGRLVIKDGYTKPDGSKFTEEDVNKFMNKNAAIYERLNGIYNKDDQAMFQRTAIGKLVFMFKKHMIPMMINRRLQKANYDYRLDAVTEGFYRTFFRQLGKAIHSKDFQQL